MKRLLYILLDLLTVICIIGAYVIQYFTKRKLGMLRWMNFQNMQFQKHTAYNILKYITVFAALLVIVLIIFGYKKKKAKLGKSDMVRVIIMVILEITYLYVTVLLSPEKITSYYLVMPLLGIAVLMQIIRNAVIVWTTKNEHNG